ncbi:ATP-binding protein [Streptosporangium lutulentum]|uniref:AAA+ ATPase domain-containing protein n=1 Tax=Streptosporangium lutulentum TaxID=1461250 RepID=A0ABT9QCD6_9ACTN|nr:ATP-binding protein [Streptosporangium lutulentum]MDP9844327.1 hypothetical protein [Streptosporangium lutulentum]
MASIVKRSRHKESEPERHAPLGLLSKFDSFQQLDQVLASAATRVSADDFLAAVRHYPPQVRQAIFHQVGLSHQKAMTPSVAANLVRVLNASDAKRLSLVGILSALAIWAFGNTDELSAEDCGLLLSEETAEKVLREAGGIGMALRNMAQMPGNLVDLILADALRRDLPLSPVALGMLAASAHRLGAEAGGVVERLWRQVQSDSPELPEAPAGADVLGAVALALMQAPHDHVVVTEEEESAPMSEDHRIDFPAQDLRRSLEQLRDCFGAAAGAAGRVHEALSSGLRPSDPDVDMIARVLDEFDEVRDQIQRISSAEVTTTVVDELERALDQAEVVQAQADRVGALVHLQGPPLLDGLLAEVRKAAAEGSSAGLEALAGLIELSADTDAILLADELEDSARRELPSRWQPVIRAALNGRLKVELPFADDVSGKAPAKDEMSDENDEEEGDEGGVTPPASAPDAGPPAGEAVVDPDSVEEISNLADLDRMLESRFGSQPEARPAQPRNVRPKASVVPEASTAEEPALPYAGSVADSEASSPGNFGEEEVAALRAQRFGLAAWIRVAVGRPHSEIAARRCAALAVDMSAFAGRLSAAFSETAQQIVTDDLSGDAAGRLLAWAASIRAGLVHPTPESARLVEELASTVLPYPAMTACGEAFSQALRSGVYLVPGLSDQMRDSAEAERDQDRATATCLRLLEEGPHRRIKFALATGVWKSLIQPEGAVGELVGVAARNDTGLLKETVEKLDKLRAADEIDRLIDREAKRSAGSRNNKIIAGARSKLVEMIDEALEHVATWATAVQGVHSRRRDGSSEWLFQGLAKLRQEVGPHRATLREEFDALAKAGDPALAAAATGAAYLITDTLHLLDGAVLSETEPTVAAVLNQDLLFAPEVVVDPESLRPREIPTLEALARIATADSLDWRMAFDTRAARDDHEGTRAVVTVLSRQDPDLAASLRQKRDALVVDARKLRDQRVEAAKDQLAGWRRDGVLTEADATRIVSRLQALAESGREDFGIITENIAALESKAKAVRAAQISAEEARLDEKSSDHPDVRAAAPRIREHIARGDLTTARECMAQAEAGKPLPTTQKAVDHFSRFFPSFPQAFESMSFLSSGGRARKRESDEWVKSLMEAIQIGRDVADPDLHRVMSEAQLDIQALPPGRREESKEGLRLWKTLALGRKAAGNLESAIKAVLRMIGLEGLQEPGVEAPNRLWVTLNEVRFGDALLPEFGSKMSPSGNSLRLLFVWRRPGPQQLIEWLKDEPQDRTVLVFYFGVLSPNQREQLTTAARRRPRPVAAVVDDAAINYLAALPEASWTATVNLLAPFSAANPYAPTGDVPMEMFYGRSSQLESVTSSSGSSIVYGGRQLGKSALLREAERSLRRSDPDRVVILETIQEIGKIVPESALWPRLAGRLAEAGALPQSGASLKDRGEICRLVRQWMEQDPTRQVLILLDEADAFLNQDAANAKFTNVEALRDLMRDTDQRVKVVFAGLHQTARFKGLSNQPLTHLGTPIPIGPLDPQDAFDLLTRPFMALGFRFQATLAARIIAEANNAPAHIQLFAEALLRRLRRMPIHGGGLPYEITREDVDTVWRDKALEVGFRDRFEWTLDLDKRYKVIAYAVAFHALSNGMDATISVQKLREECLTWWPAGFKKCTSDDFRGLLEECANLGVLSSDVDGYRLRTPHVLTLLGGADEVNTILSKAEEFEQPDSFDAHSYRALYRNGPDRSPLTGGQVTRLLSPGDSLHLITGSEALHIERVGAALKEEAERQHVAQVWRVGNGCTFEGAVQRARDSAGHGVVVVNLAGRSFEQATETLKSAASAVSSGGPGTLAVALVAPPELIPLWLAVGTDTGELSRLAWVMELRRYDEPDVRQWMNDADLGYRNPASQDALLKHTGGWPLLISKVVEGQPADRDHALERCRDWIRANAGEFIRATGVLRDSTLRQAWQQMIEVGPARPDELAEYLEEMAGDEATDPLHRDSLRANGYPSWAALVEVLRLLGALEPRDDGTFACEPVLAAASDWLEGRA